MVWPSTPFVMPATVQQREGTTPQITYPKSYRFDFALGDFALTVGGRVAIADGATAWGQHVLKTATTQQAAHPVYSRRYGADLDRAMQPAPRAVQQSRVQRAIVGALRADPRTGAVTDFAFTWRDADALEVAFAVVPAVRGTATTVEIRVRGSD